MTKNREEHFTIQLEIYKFKGNAKEFKDRLDEWVRKFCFCDDSVGFIDADVADYDVRGEHKK